MGQFGFGQSVRRKEDVRFITGRGRYALTGSGHLGVVDDPETLARIAEFLAQE